MVYDLKTQEKKVTAKYANHAKEDADWGFPSRIWRISRLNLLASRRGSLPDLCAPVVKIRVTSPRCPASGNKANSTLRPNPGPIMRNKAKLGRVGVPGRWRAGEGAIVKNEPNLPIRAQAGTGRRTSPAGPSRALIAPNKPNFPSGETKGKGFEGKELW
jgi:hypothetical protein